MVLFCCTKFLQMKELLKNLWRLIMLLTFMLGTTTVFAQAAGNELEIKGTVVSGNENVLLAGSTVSIKDAGGKLIGSVTTGSDGVFILKAKPMSTISVAINYLSFKDYNSGAISLKQENLDLEEYIWIQKVPCLRELRWLQAEKAFGSKC